MTFLCPIADGEAMTTPARYMRQHFLFNYLFWHLGCCCTSTDHIWRTDCVHPAKKRAEITGNHFCVPSFCRRRWSEEKLDFNWLAGDNPQSKYIFIESHPPDDIYLYSSWLFRRPVIFFLVLGSAFCFVSVKYVLYSVLFISSHLGRYSCVNN